MQTVVFDCGSATPLAIEQAAYRLAPAMTVVVEPRVSQEAPFVCQIDLKAEGGSEDVEVAEFRRHVNDYFLREQIGAKTEGVRILLYAQAFSQATGA
jgi:His-Xaa-Ser system protein HxsD